MSDTPTLDALTVYDQNANVDPDKLRKGASRLQEKVKEARDETKLEKAWRAGVWARDKWHDRLTKRKCKRTIELDPLRGECHHIEPRVNQAVRWDVRNGILLTLETHERVTKHELRIVGTRFFTVNGKRYIDATYRVRFAKP